MPAFLCPRRPPFQYFSTGNLDQLLRKLLIFTGQNAPSKLKKLLYAKTHY